ncbi:MAG TPA: type II secretion system protein GspG [Patescibacteria group bacterium]|nr:type II secretion system protein GspG [Patescibacteria group bacterium]
MNIEYKIIRVIIICVVIFCIIGLGIIVFESSGVGNELKWLLKIDKDARRISDIQNIQQALDAYYAENNIYPFSTIMCSSWKLGEGTEGMYIPDLKKYLPNQPHDPEEQPNSCPNYCYESLPNGTDYRIHYNLKEKNEKEAIGYYNSECNTFYTYTVCGKDAACQNYQERASNKNADKLRITDIQKIQEALERYYTDNHQYPIAAATCSSWTTIDRKKIKNYIPYLDTYISEQPHDPEERLNSCPNYCYISLPDGSDYQLQYNVKNEEEEEIIGYRTVECNRYATYAVCGKDEKCTHYLEHVNK